MYITKMSRSVVLPFSEKKFASKKELESYAKKVALNTLNIPIEKGHEYYDFLCDLIRQRTPGIMPTVFLFADRSYEHEKHILNALNIRNNETYRPHYKLEDGSEWVTFSLKKVVYAKTTTEKQKLTEAFRDEIEY